MKILLVEPPGGLVDDKEYSISSRENLGLGYLAAVLRAENHDVELVSCPALGWKASDMLSWTARFHPELVGIGLPFTDELKGAYFAIKALAEELGPDVPLIAGGHAATASPRELLDALPEIAAVVRGEGEVTMLEVVRCVQRGQEFSAVNGLSTKTSNRICSTGNRELISNLDTLPFPARDTLRAKKDSGAMPEEIYLTASRGCPYRCSFCDIKTFYKSGKGLSWRGRSPANIVEELRFLLQEFGPDHAYVFVDDQFMGPGRTGQERVKKVATEILGAGLELSFEITCRADSIDRETMLCLKEAGLGGVYLGLDSGSQAALDRFQKDIKVEQNLEAVKLLRELDIPVDFGFIMYDPWTTPEDVRANSAFLDELVLLGVPVHPAVHTSKLKFYPGTPIAEKAGATHESTGILRDAKLT